MAIFKQDGYIQRKDLYRKDMIKGFIYMARDWQYWVALSAVWPHRLAIGLQGLAIGPKGWPKRLHELAIGLHRLA